MLGAEINRLEVLPGGALQQFLVLGSMLLRTGIVLAGFYFVANQNMERLVACLFGFIMARLLVTQMTRTAGEPRPAREARHAP